MCSRSIASRGDTRFSASTRTRGPLFLIIDPKATYLVDHCRDAGFQPDPDNPEEEFVPRNPLHCGNLCEFVRKDLCDGQVYAVPNSESKLIVGEDLIVTIAKGDFARIRRDH